MKIKGYILAKTSVIFSIVIPMLLTLTYIGCSGKEDPLPNDKPTPEPEVVLPFENIPNLSEMIIYEINPLAFGPDGTFNNIVSKLDHIQKLGVNVIWLMPIFPKGIENGVGSPYAVQNYTDVNPDYGKLSDFKTLVDKAHELNMAVIIDWVANHTAWDNSWIDNEGWYTIDSNGEIINPPGTNWKDVAELNFKNMEMRAEMIAAMKFWVDDYNIDGFRFDAVDFVPDSFWAQALDSLKNYENRNLILLAESGNTNVMKTGFQILYAWDFQSKLRDIFHQGSSAKSIHQTHTNEYAALKNGNQRLRYITNHDLCAWDESPSDAFVNANGATAAFVVTTFMGGVPLIYNGQEIGWPNKISFFDFNPINWHINTKIYSAYTNIIKARKTYHTTVSGSTQALNDNDVIAFTKTGLSEQLMVVVNTRNKNVEFNLSTATSNTNWSSILGEASIIDGNKIELKAFEYVVFSRKLSE